MGAEEDAGQEGCCKTREREPVPLVAPAAEIRNKIEGSIVEDGLGETLVYGQLSSHLPDIDVYAASWSVYQDRHTSYISAVALRTCQPCRGGSIATQPKAVRGPRVNLRREAV